MKTITCKDMDLASNCEWEGMSENIEQLIEKAKSHIKNAHKDYWKRTMSKMDEIEIKETLAHYIKEE